MFDLLIGLAWLVLKVAGACLLAYLLVMVFLHYRAVKRLNFYEQQGATLYPGCKSFFFGNMWDMVAYQKAYFGDAAICGP